MRAPVGIVLVSHSTELVAGLRKLVEQIGSDEVPLATADVTIVDAPFVEGAPSSCRPICMPGRLDDSPDAEQDVDTLAESLATAE